MQDTKEKPENSETTNSSQRSLNKELEEDSHMPKTILRMGVLPIEHYFTQLEICPPRRS